MSCSFGILIQAFGLKIKMILFLFLLCLAPIILPFIIFHTKSWKKISKRHRRMWHTASRKEINSGVPLNR